jgi:hypothetical protein
MKLLIADQTSVATLRSTGRLLLHFYLRTQDKALANKIPLMRRKSPLTAIETNQPSFNAVVGIDTIGLQ